MADETGDVEIRSLYRVASDLHTNFYEDRDEYHHVAAGLDDVDLLLDKLERLPWRPAACVSFWELPDIAKL